MLVGVPGAFTPTCQVSHITSYVKHIDQLKAKGIDQVVVIAMNDPFVMSAWGKANYSKDDFIVSNKTPTTTPPPSFEAPPPSLSLQGGTSY